MIVDIAMLERDSFAEALMTALYNSTYRENMQMLSRLHRDQPMKPLDQAVFWIEYVIRHKGTGHLQTQSYKMSWFVYKSLDVIAFLLTVALLMMLICVSCLRLVWRMIFTGKKVKRE